MRCCGAVMTSSLELGLLVVGLFFNAPMRIGTARQNGDERVDLAIAASGPDVDTPYIGRKCMISPDEL
jgi:hypothetical protein